jgi:hypothetical protein
MSDAPDAGGPVETVAAPDAPAGAGDPTRRWAIRSRHGAPRFAGVTRTEAAAVAGALAVLPPEAWEGALVAVELPVVLSDGAGPYLLDADGRLTLALGPHPHLADALVAMGHPAPRHRIGLVRRLGEGRLWTWLARVEAPPDRRVAVLDALEAVSGGEALAVWVDRHAG